MVINSININNTMVTTVSLLKSLYEHKTTTTYGVGNQGISLGQAIKCGRVKTFDGIQPSASK